MSEKENKEVLELLGVLRQLKPLDKSKIITPEYTEACACGKLVSPTKFTTLDTGVMVVVNNVCKGCKEGAKEDSELARIVCVRCKKVVARIKPQKDAKDGFVFEAGKSYHTDMCPGCVANAERSIIIEKRILELRKNKE